MPHQTEPSANNALDSILQGMLGKATVRSEKSQVIQGHAGLQSDILVISPGRSPVVIESEYDPAKNVEPEATGRLSLNVTGQARPMETVVGPLFPRVPTPKRDVLTINQVRRTRNLPDVPWGNTWPKPINDRGHCGSGDSN